MRASPSGHRFRITQALVVVAVALTWGCNYTGTITPPAATACTPYTFTAAVTLPAGVTGTVTTVGGFPASITVTVPTVAGTPTWAEAGASPYTVTASGTVTTAVPWYRNAAWSGSSTFVVNPPTTTFAPATGFTIPAFAQMSNPVTLSLTSAGTPPCPYNAQYPARLPGLAVITTTPAPPQASDPVDAVTITLARDTNAAWTGNLPVTLVPTGGGPNVVVNIPVTAL